MARVGAKTGLPTCRALLTGGHHFCEACPVGAVHLHLLPVPTTPSRRWLPLSAEQLWECLTWSCCNAMQPAGCIVPPHNMEVLPAEPACLHSAAAS